MPAELKIHPFCLGDWQTNCYVIHPVGSPECWIIDAGFAPQAMIRMIQREGLAPQRIVLTHAHIDHIAGLPAVREAFPGAPVLIHEAEADFLTTPELNLSAAIAMDFATDPADQLLHHGDTLTLGDLTFAIRHTPGHSPGGICMYQAANAVAFVGDTLFRDSIGRHDFPTSDGPTLMRSIREQLLTLPDATRIYPGHMQATTIERERRLNPFLSDDEG